MLKTPATYCHSDVEGYGIYYMVMEALGLRKYKTLRFFETSMTERDILQSFKDMTDLFADPKHKCALDAYICRSRRDWALGMNMSVLNTIQYGMLIKYGSVKSPLMRMLYENHCLVSSYIKTVSFGIKSIHPNGNFESTLLNDDDNKDRSFINREDAEKFASTLATEATVKSYESKTKITKPHTLYSLSDLQIDAAKPPLSLTPDETLNICQSLYETHKILSYPRTSGTYLSSGKVKDLPGMLQSIKDIPDIKPFVIKITADDIARVSSDPNIINDKEVAKASHDALVPTGLKVDWDALSSKEKSVYLLIAKRLISHFMPCFVEEKTTLLLENNGDPFKANGRKTIENGFNDLYGKTFDDVIIPVCQIGDTVAISENIVYEKESTPPARYTMGTIIKAMKNIGNSIDPVDPEKKALRQLMKASDGLGTEATRASILKELQDSGYITTKKNTIYITETGIAYAESIRQAKEGNGWDWGMADPMQVAYWSARNNMVKNGEESLDDVLNDFYKYLNKKISDIKSSGDPIKRSRAEQASLGLPACPLCGAKVLSGKFGYYCSTYKESHCPLSIPNEMAGKTLTDNQKKGLLEGKKIHAKGFKSKAGKIFEADVKLNKETGKVEFDFGPPKKK